MSGTKFTFVKIQSTHTLTVSNVLFVDNKDKKIKIIKRRR